MIIRITKNNIAIPLPHIRKEDEKSFMEINGDSGIFRQVNSLPESHYASYSYDEVLGECVFNQELDNWKYQQRLNISSNQYLSDTDWYVSRYSETGVPVPADILLKRQEARDAITGETI